MSPDPAAAPVRPAEPKVRRSLLRRWITLLVVLFALTGLYAGVRRTVLRPLLYAVAQRGIDQLWSIKVKKIGRVRFDFTGHLFLENVEAVTDLRGEKRPFFRARSVVMTYDSAPWKTDAVLMRVDLIEPEIFALRYPDGDWNVSHAFTPRDEPSVAGDGGFVANGIHVSRGTVHLTFRDEERKEVDWEVDRLEGIISERDGVLLYEVLDGQFYGGRIVARSSITSQEPLSIDLSVKIRGADIAVMSAGAEFLQRPVSGTLDAVLTMSQDPRKTGVDPVVAGYAHIRNGDLWEFPVMVGVLNVLSLQSVAERRIEQAEVRFTLMENRIRIDQAEFIGEPLTLYGDGFVDLMGKRVEIVFVPQITSGLLKIVPIVDLAIGALVPIKVEGSWARATAEIRKDQEVSGPVRELLEKEKK